MRAPYLLASFVKSSHKIKASAVLGSQTKRRTYHADTTGITPTQASSGLLMQQSSCPLSLRPADVLVYPIFETRLHTCFQDLNATSPQYDVISDKAIT